ncbi:VWA domain-containing protein [Candidatus Nitrospira neomarina]|uniref:VWA domain-containing protein n=1 Tax=Candidatus Nitrospira neomarina TaxID=3020899 RepID=A0AA96GJ40_9BACT|nr:VWA domain-containing protein [Candidatus Nitrospira neomarina]WNM61130.1 VWA domain-containing protein [Candidatus Nitrospira neomarina]
MAMFHFLRPEWFWGLLPLFGLFLLIARKGTTDQIWESVCDAHLLPHLLVGTEGATRRMPLVLLGSGWIVAVFALAGPVWSQLPQPVFRAESALVMVLDLSRSMDAQDVTPSRLTRAKHKILDMLKTRKEGQTALVVYAGESFVVSPLTNDANTLVTLVQSLETELMPLQGSRTDLALEKAHELLQHVGQARGDVLLLTDGEGDPATLKVVGELQSQGMRVSVLGIGTVDGAPIPETGGFLKDQDGTVVIPKLDIPSLQAIARVGGGHYATVSADDQDINRVLPSVVPRRALSSSTSEQRTTDLWREEGPWLVLLLLVLALPAFRPGWLGMLLAFLLIPQVSEAFSWENLWVRPDQQGIQALERDAPEEAADLFQDPGWKGIAHYRSGKYQEAEKAFSIVDTPEGHYNRGNALANLGRYEEALASYQTALTRQPDHADARHNLEIIKQLLEKSSSAEQAGESPQQSDGSSATQNNHGNEAGGQGEKSQNPSDSTHTQSDSKTVDSQKEKPEEAGSGSDSVRTSNQSNEDQNSSEESFEREAQGRNPLKAEPSKKPLSAPPTMEEKPEDQTELSELSSAGDAAQSPEIEKSEQILQQWLRRIPDDPGGLLRRKFLLEHQRRVEAGRSTISQGKGW